MSLANLIINIFWYVGWFILDHPFLSAIIFLVFVYIIALKFYGIDNPYKKTKSDFTTLSSASKKEIELECPNCGAALKSSCTICEYCGAHCRVSDKL